MSPIETELKLLLPEGDYQRLRRAGNLLSRTDQLNVYFHDPARLEEDLGYLRVRYETDRPPVATLKIPVGWVGDTRRMEEVERPLADLGPAFFPRPRRWIQVEDDLPEVYRRHFRAMEIRCLRRLGWMRNLRCVVELSPHGTVELDRTRLPGGRIRYEVEIEDPSEETRASLLARVTEVAPGAQVSRVGKFTTFLAASGWGRSRGS